MFFLSLIPELKVEGGHLYPYHQTIKRAIESLGGSHSAYVHAKCTIENLGPGWKRWFRRKEGSHLRYFFRLFADFCKLYRHEGRESSRRILFYDSLQTRDLAALVLASYLFAKRSDEVWLLFRYDLEKKEMMRQRLMTKLLIRKLGKRAILLCDSSLLAAALETTFGTSFSLLPHYLSPIQCEKRARKEKISCAWLGEPRAEKGLSTIQKLVTLDDPLSEKFSLRLSSHAPLSGHANRLTIYRIQEGSCWETYARDFAQSDVILLPYDPIRYRYRSSGVFIEAILGGKIPLVCSSTWHAHELSAFALDELIFDWEAPLFFSRLKALLETQQMHIKLAQMREAYQELHSQPSLTATLETYLTCQFFAESP